MWHANGHKLAIQINISAGDLDEPALVTHIAKHLHLNYVEPNCLTLEITENLVINNQSESLKALQQLRDLGIGISLDDFGTGYSSMTLLHQLPLTQIKIDRSFVIGMEDNNKHTAIVQSTLDLGIKMGLEVIAEGVENGHQAQLLKQMNCALIHGYDLAKPMPAEKLD